MISKSSNNQIRIDIALIPSKLLFSAVIDASQAITQRFRNNNIIDADRFPPHISLHICTIPNNNLSLFTNDVVLSNSKIVSLKPTRLSMASSGYIFLEVEKSPAIYKLHERIINISARIRGSHFEDLLQEKWPRLTNDHGKGKRHISRKIKFGIGRIKFFPATL